MTPADLDRIKRIANNALYFNDNSEYSTALWEILDIVSPGHKLEYMEDAEGD